MARKYKERHKELIDSLEAVMFPFQESEFEAESFTDIGRQRVDEWLDRTLGAAEGAQGWQPIETAPCVWKQHDDYDDDYWESDCGEAWCFIDGTPAENKVKFCHGCGGKVVLADPPAREET